MALKYNSKIYRNLLKYDTVLRQMGTNLRQKNHLAYRKQLKYGVMVSDYLHWQERASYISLLENFVNSKINAEQFDIQFQELHQKIEQKIRDLEEINSKELDLLIPDSKSVGFSEWTSNLDYACDDFYPYYEDSNQEKFRVFISDEILPNIKKYCEK